MIRRPPRSTRTDTLFPYTTLFRSADEKLDYLLGRLRRIKHVEFIRLGTKVPTVLPMRIPRGLTRMLRKHHPLWMSIIVRSVERRVGKEWVRTRTYLWWPEH